MLKTVKTRLGRVIILPTPEEDASITAAAMSDPDAMPFTDAEWAQVKPLVRRGCLLGPYPTAGPRTPAKSAP